MEEIKVNEYVRTWDGIKKIVKINEGKDITIHGKYIVEPQYKNSSSISVNNILKHSPNIIDLIEEGDYVNGERVLCFKNENCDYDIGTEYSDNLGEYYGFNKEDIKDIVTHEQFNQVKYEV